VVGNRRSGTGLVRVAAAIVAVGLAGAAGAHSGPAAARLADDPVDDRPNVVLVVTDDQTLENQRVLAYVRAELGGRGTTFTDAVVSYPLCCPSRSTILTGQYAHNHGVLGNHWPRGGYRLLDHTNTLATWLDDAGYYTAFVGKYLNEYGSRDAPAVVPPGWDDWFAKVGAGHVYYGYTVLDDDALLHFGEAPADYSTDVYAAHAADVVRSRAGQDGPFFLEVAPLAPHGADENQSTPPPRYDGVFAAEPVPRPPSFNEADVSDKPAYVADRAQLTADAIAAVDTRYRRRLETLLAVDDLVRGLVDALKEIGEYESTVLIFTSDNGFLEGQHRIAQGKVVPYEESVRVPLVVAGPGFPAGVRVHSPVANVDIAPTIVAAAGATAGRAMDGVPLQAVASDPAAYAGRPMLLEAFGTGGYAGVRTGEWVWVEYDTGEAELYHLGRDPWQLVSRHDDPRVAADRDRLAAQLAQLRTCSGVSCHLLTAGPRAGGGDGAIVRARAG
jgi:N-acetylglucosamine-6-sulfatase